MRWRYAWLTMTCANTRGRCRSAKTPGAPIQTAERARVESIGAVAMDGVAENLDAALQQRCGQAGYSRVTDKSRAPMDDALEFVLREVLTGRKLPPAAEQVAAVWRS